MGMFGLWATDGWASFIKTIVDDKYPGILRKLPLSKPAVQ